MAKTPILALQLANIEYQYINNIIRMWLEIEETQTYTFNSQL